MQFFNKNTEGHQQLIRWPTLFSTTVQGIFYQLSFLSLDEVKKKKRKKLSQYLKKLISKSILVTRMPTNRRQNPSKSQKWHHYPGKKAKFKNVLLNAIESDWLQIFFENLTASNAFNGTSIILIPSSKNLSVFLRNVSSRRRSVSTLWKKANVQTLPSVVLLLSFSIFVLFLRTHEMVFRQSKDLIITSDSTPTPPGAKRSLC